MRDLDNPFWTFSLAVYGAPGVASECLALQSAWEIDVNCLLFCAWLGAEHGIVLADTNLHAIDTAARDWHQSVVRPLRSARQSLKTLVPRISLAAVLRADIARDELLSEQIEQHLLFQSLAALQDGSARAAAREATRHNVSAFLRWKSGGGNTRAQASAECLIGAAIAYSAKSRSHDPS